MDYSFGYMVLNSCAFSPFLSQKSVYISKHSIAYLCISRQRIMNFKSLHNAVKDTSVMGRYLPEDRLKKLIDLDKKNQTYRLLGSSENGRDIHGILIGRGEKRVLAWSQMHGNESTTTKGIIDFVRLLSQDALLWEYVSGVLNQFTFLIIPILNPDGAQLYTRENASGIDLNRDALSQTQREIQVLMRQFEAFRPDLCLNLHDQRSIYGVGDLRVPATLSFLAPSVDTERTISPARLEAMDLIVKMVLSLQDNLPGQIGRYDDAFNESCVGDFFQKSGVPTILIEAGHYPQDDAREHTRYFVFEALFHLFKTVIKPSDPEGIISDYMAIPENHKNLRDLVFKNVRLNNTLVSIGLQKDYEIVNDREKQFLKVENVDPEQLIMGYTEIDFKGEELLINSHENDFVGEKIVTIELKKSKKLIKI